MREEARDYRGVDFGCRFRKISERVRAMERRRDGQTKSEKASVPNKSGTSATQTVSFATQVLPFRIPCSDPLMLTFHAHPRSRFS